ncbi:hypothetical protein PAXRUDRAFT_835887 [Paxillus rubicundulus Ve08.2h10]|uniref:Uncharacterized protein n=1 Tax=Paxillus rubicundulus Ve08.2h10 TaxID=930991 RepID=A0A0D0CI22_9AGAM|nr:hypothetical protein PAXRUDRAFT_835887 [Paxillus rubicundulus Ve08.2h10]
MNSPDAVDILCTLSSTLGHEIGRVWLAVYCVFVFAQGVMKTVPICIGGAYPRHIIALSGGDEGPLVFALCG